MAAASREERVTGEVVFDGRVLRLEVDRVRCGNGHEAVREVVRHPGAAVVLPLLGDGRVVLVRQFRYPTGVTVLELPAGKLDPGEAPRDCALRELEEETGWRARTILELGWFFTTPGFTDERLHAFLATDLERGSMAADDDEDLEVVLLPVAELRRQIAGGEVRDGKTIVALSLAALQGRLEGWVG